MQSKFIMYETQSRVRLLCALKFYSVFNDDYSHGTAIKPHDIGQSALQVQAPIHFHTTTRECWYQVSIISVLIQAPLIQPGTASRRVRRCGYHHISSWNLAAFEIAPFCLSEKSRLCLRQAVMTIQLSVRTITFYLKITS